jgi:hypothetical protein
MKHAIALTVLVLGALAGPPDVPTPNAPSLEWKALDDILGPGREAPGGVRRYGWPRRDLDVSVRGVRIEPALALGSWAAFAPSEPSGDTMAMGDLVLLASEVNPVVASLQKNGLEVLAIHNHLIDETPRLVYVHFGGHGPAIRLGRGLADALGRTKTPTPPGPATGAGPSPEEKKIFEAIQKDLGRKGSLAGRVLQVGVARSQPIEEGGQEVPPSMGVATALNFQVDGPRVLATGDFVLVADEVNPVVEQLQKHSIDVTALHSHMLRETPRIFFLHFWASGPPETVSAGLAAAISKTASRP